MTAARTDVRLLDAPMEPVTCQQCRARVEVRKSSWEQTSIQWHPDAAEACAERRAVNQRPGPNGAVFPGCEALRASVRDAVRDGEIAIPDDQPLPTNPEAPA